MDVLDRVREIGADVELTEVQVAEALDRVRAGLRTEPSRSRRVLWIGIGAGGVLATAAAATAIVVAVSTPQSVVMEAATPTPTATAPDVIVTVPAPTVPPPEVVGAAAVLEHAAELAPLASPLLKPGQYLRVESRIEYVVTYDADAEETAPYGAPRSEAQAGWLVTSSYDTYIPADRYGEWVRVFNPNTTVIAWYGPGADALAAEWERQVQRTEPIVERIQGGLIEPYEEGYTLGSPEYHDAMPRDPQALLDWYWSYYGLEDEERATEILAQVVIQDLEINAAPADLRASMFRALSLVEGVALQSVEGDITTLAFEPGHSGSRPVTLSIDTRTGLVVGSTTSGAGGTVIPEAVPDHRVITTTTVVDSAP